MNAHELEVLARTLEERLNNAIDAFNDLSADYKSNLQAQTERRQRVEIALAFLEEGVKSLKAWQEREEKEREAYLHLTRDVAELLKWKADLKHSQEEWTRRKWSFGPNIVGSLIALFGVLISVGVNLLILYWKNRN